MAAKKKVKKKMEEEEIEELEAEGELPKKAVRSRESRQLIWMIAVIVLVFAAFLILYFYVESARSFDYRGVNWTVEEYSDAEIFHGRFTSVLNDELNYNIYFWNDPRTNEVPVDGKFGNFGIGGYVSFDETTAYCNGDLPGATISLGAFLKTGIGVTDVKYASSDPKVASDKGIEHVNCLNTKDRTVVLVKIGESSVTQSADNGNCYIIQVEDCNDIKPIEKFMTEVVSAFKE